MSRIFTTSFADVYPHYVNKVERKGRTKAELDEVIEWLTGFDEAALNSHLAGGTTFEGFFADASLNPNVSLIKGVVCGVRVEDDPVRTFATIDFEDHGERVVDLDAEDVEDAG